MHALVVYESMFGSTKAVAEAIAEGLSTRSPVDIVEVGQAPEGVLEGDLLVVGGPTHAFGLSRPSTRKAAAGQSKDPLVSRSQGLREWLDALPRGTGRGAAAAFDTRVRKPGFPGSAAGAAARRLRRLGFNPMLGRMSFYVGGSTEPLLPGELDRARQWGMELGVEFARLDRRQRS